MSLQGTLWYSQWLLCSSSLQTKVSLFRKSNEELCLDVWAGVLSVTFDVCIVGVATVFA